MDFSRWRFIINPASGHTRSHVTEYLSRIQSVFAGADSVLTEGRGDATRLAREARAAGKDHIIIAGGDGTINEAVQSLAGDPHAVLGVLPCGTGNDYAAALGMGSRMGPDSWDRLLRAVPRRADLGWCNGRYFVNGVGVGYDAEVAVGVLKRSLLRGKLRYWWVILKNLLFYREQALDITWPQGRVRDRCFLVTAGIGRHFGGGFPLTPRAWLDDGLLDVCLVHTLSVHRRLKKLLILKKGLHLEEPEVEYATAAELCIEAGDEVPAHMDGEVLYAKKYTLKVLKNELNVLYYPGSGHYFQEKG